VRVLTLPLGDPVRFHTGVIGTMTADNIPLTGRSQKLHPVGTGGDVSWARPVDRADLRPASRAGRCQAAAAAATC
jgi:hypothetical protein